MRKAIAKSLGNSKFTAPDFSLNIEVDMDNAMASRVKPLMQFQILKFLSMIWWLKLVLWH